MTTSMTPAFALEMIAMQPLDFRDKLITAFEALMEHTGPNTAQDSKELKKIEDMILARTGVNIRLNVDTDDYPCILPGYLNTFNSLEVKNYSMKEAFEVTPAFAEMALKGQVFRGSVDFKNARLSGDYTKIQMPVHFSFTFMKTVTAARAAGMTMHEVGHGFTFMVCAWRMYRANMFIGQMARALLQPEEGQRYTHIVKALAKKMEDEGIALDKDLNALYNAKTVDGISTITVGAAVTKIQSDFGSINQAAHTAESMADLFATRFGFGNDLAEMLLDDYEPSLKDNPYKKIVGVHISLAIGALLLPLGPAIGISAVVACLGLGTLLGGHREGVLGLDDLYGHDKDRFNRIRMVMIDTLKDPTINSATRKNMLAQIDSIEKMLIDAREVTGLLDDIHNFIFSFGRKTKSAIELERKLETLSANDLFVGAASLKNL